MPRFTDEWLIDRVLFDYVSGGSCACCGFQHFLPNGTADLISAVSDLETDQAQQEVAALQHHPWPVELRDQVWADRVRLRQRLKKEMKSYADFWTLHGAAFQEWCRNQSNLNRLAQLPRSEVLETIRQKYNIHSAYAVVLCAVVEQVANFELTCYPTDGRGDAEVSFERELNFDRRGGFTMRLVNEEGTIDEKVLEVLWKRMQTLGGPKLLEKGSSTEREDEGEADEPAASASKPSFQSDRRIIRLIIARYWADLFQKRYLSEMAKDIEASGGDERK